MSFNYPHTCPDIDNSIKDTKNVLHDSISEMLSECCPLWNEKHEFVKQWVENLYLDLENNYEGVRSSNQDMRSEAERVIGDLEEEIENLTFERDQLQEKIDDLEYRLESLEK